MRRFPAVLSAAVLALAGCSFSSVDPDARVEISGRVLDASGAPLSGATVLLFKQADLGEVVFGTVLAIGSLGTVCLLPDPPALCASADTVSAGPDGRYRFELDGADTQGSLGTASTLSVVVGGPRGSTTLSFTVKDETVSLPDAQLWDARPRASRAGTDVRLAWSPLPGGDRASYSALVFEPGREVALWSEPAEAGRARIDARILEGGSGQVAAGARTTPSGSGGTGRVTADFLSRRLDVRSSVGTPPSRGRRCAPVTGTAPPRTGTYGPCAATDGDLATPTRLSGTGTVTGVVVDLGRSRRVELVVARGFAGQVLVETSGGGRRFTTVATASGTVAIPLPPGTTARFVRLRSPAGLDESLSSEVSVW